ncbi:MAG: RidA family protein [Bryobacterales bacterium]|nr:Rid family hydrolase [Bryobacteraceae bacterium]MDW8130764.1 RidA family protein [Bryobacterales bacterium]
MRLVLLLIALSQAIAAERRAVFPEGVKPIGPYSPGILAGDSLYVSGQGARAPDGTMAQDFRGQLRQTLENVRAVVEAAGLTLAHVVYAQIYLEDASRYDEVAALWREFFPRNPPACAVVGVMRMPGGTPVEINAVALRDRSRRRSLEVRDAATPPFCAAVVEAGDRVYLSGIFGREGAGGNVPADPARQVEAALDGMGRLLAAVGLDYRHMVFVNPYLTAAMPMEVMNRLYAKRFEFGNTPARATIRVAALPGGAGIEFTGVAVKDLALRRVVRPKNMAPSATASPCVFAGDVLYCSAKSGFIPGPRSGIYAATVEHQLRQTMRNLLDGLEEAGLEFSHVVATNVYLDDIADFERMNRVYAQYFAPGAYPARTTVQPLAPVERKPDPEDRWPMLEQVSLIAVR